MKLWSYTAGSYGNTVVVSERTEGGYIYARWTEGGKRRVKSLKHRIKARARNYAHELSDKLAGGCGAANATLSTILLEYSAYHTPSKGAREQSADIRRVAFFTGEWGNKKPGDITLKDWDRFIKDRRRNGAGDRTIEADLKWLNSALNWASRWRTDAGYLLDENPVRGYPIPHEKNPHQPVMTHEMFLAFLSAAAQGEKRDRNKCDLLITANETGRRLSAILGLRWADIDLEKKTVVWREDTDKTGKRSLVPLSDHCAHVLKNRRSREQLRSVYVFPAPRDKDKPMHRNRAQAWAEQLSEQAGIPWPGWHSIRRKAVSEAPATQAAAKLFGYANLRTMLMCYNKPDMESLREVSEQRVPYRGAR
jgi:integrase